jgi:hypothetical protein
MMVEELQVLSCISDVPVGTHLVSKWIATKRSRPINDSLV